MDEGTENFDTLTAGMAETSDSLGLDDVVSDAGETFASGDQAASDAGQLDWLDRLRIAARRDPLTTVAAAIGAGVILGLFMSR